MMNVETPYNWAPILVCPECSEMTRASYWVDESLSTTRFACEACGFEALEGISESYPDTRDPRVYEINGIDRTLHLLLDLINHPSLGVSKALTLETPVGEVMDILSDLLYNATDSMI